MTPSRMVVRTLLGFIIPALLFLGFLAVLALAEHLDRILAIATVVVTVLGLVTATAGGYAIAQALTQRRIRR